MDKITKINKNFVILIILLVCLAMVLVSSFQQNTYAATNIENNIISQFAEKYGIEEDDLLSGEKCNSRKVQFYRTISIL